MSVVWKPVVGYEGLYEVSNCGKVRSVEHYTNGHHLMAKELKPTMSQRYLYVKLYKNAKPRTIRLHRIVAEAFVPNPMHKPQVNHINGNRLDNSVGNLEWCTSSENLRHAYKTGLKDIEDSMRKIRKKVLQLDMDGNAVREWRSMSDAARELGLQVSNISHCCKGRIRSTGGYRWELVSER